MKNRQVVLLTCKGSWVRLALASIWIFLCVAAVNIVLAEGWTRGVSIGTKPASEFTSEPFVLVVWGGEDDHVHGICTYYNWKSVVVTIDGMQAPNGDFYPTVVAQVANDEQGQWKSLGISSSGGAAKSLTVEPLSVSKPLLVDLDVFRPLISTFKYGRLVLNSGEAVKFELKVLLPPSDKEKK